MKSLMIITLMLVGTSLYGQSLTLSTGLETTVAGTELHLSGGYITKNNWSLAAFHQFKITPTPDESIPNKSGSGWYGIYVNAPLASSKKINVIAQVRAGLIDNRFIVIVPAVETHIHLSKLLTISLGSSLRYAHPGFSVKTYIHPFNSKKH